MISSGGRRALGWAASAAGLGASALGVVLAVQAIQPPPDIGALPAPIASSPAPAADGIAPSPATGAGSTAPSAAASAESPATGDGNAAIDWGVPSQVTIGALGVNAVIDPVGVRPDRALDIPDDAHRLGWWIGSATPGSARGTVLVAGHVDTAKQGPGALFRLERLPLGSTIDLRAGGRTVTYRAVARRSYQKQKLPTDLFDRAGPPRLVLVTCGGTFHSGTYSHNVVVYAVPVGPPAR